MTGQGCAFIDWVKLQWTGVFFEYLVTRAF